MSNKSYIIGISGGSGSGKTSFLQSLKTILKGKQICYISLDDYYIPREEQIDDENGIKNFDLPGSIDSKKLAKHLEILLEGKEIEIKKYDFNNALAEEKTEVLKPAPIIVLEGLFIYHYQELNKFFDLKLYVEAKPVTKLVRRIRRDRLERNYPIEDVLYRYEHHVTPSYKSFIEPYKDEADLIVNNNKTFKTALSVVAAYVNQLLKAQE